MQAVQPFLFNLFSDKDIFRLPFGQKLFAGIISSRRAPKIIEEYRQIGGSSPINKWTEIQRSMLEKSLKETYPEIEVFTAMRYWNPLTKETAGIIRNKFFDRIILLPLYPHYSISTTGSSFNEWKRCFGEDKRAVFINNYCDNEDYIEALNERIDKAIEESEISIRSNLQLVFSAHGTPVSMVKSGDPYSIQIEKTVRSIMEKRKQSHEWHLCFQSKVGPVKWLEPSTENTIKKLAAEGKKNLIIIPVSFVSDHIETLYELDIEYRHTAKESGIESYKVIQGLNDSPLFINALKKIVLSEIK